jgi:pimeloyl-ACP methyl ester carboxylesterase
VAADLRGHGQSDKPHDTYTIQLFADDPAFLCGELGLAKPVVIGHSMGGVVAFAFAARYPKLPSAIVTIDQD